LPRQHQRRFPAGESYLARYAARLNATEINSSFYRPHLSATYERWAASVPAGFRFSAKVPQEITHELRLVGTGQALDRFLAETAYLGRRLGCLLLQFPPSLAFDARNASRFFALLRRRHDGPVVAEPRHASWFAPAADALFVASRIARVAADPHRAVLDAEPGGWHGVAYFRLHGSPVIYRSTYDPARLRALAARIRLSARGAKDVWCIFDNTMLGAASANALDLTRLLRPGS